MLEREKDSPTQPTWMFRDRCLSKVVLYIYAFRLSLLLTTGDGYLALACEVMKKNVKILIMIQGEEMVVEISSVTIAKIKDNLYSL